MGIKTDKPYFVFFLALFALASCGQTSPDSSLSAASPLQNASNASGEFSSANLTRPPVSLSEVDVSNLIVANTRDNGLPARSLHFTATGTSDYVDVQLCHATKGCEETMSVVVDEVLLNASNSGKYTVRARACVFPTRAKVANELCGEWKVANFEMSGTIDSAIATLINERTAKRNQLKQYADEMQNIHKNFLQTSQVCAKGTDSERLNAIRGIVQNYLALGEQIIDHSVCTNEANAKKEHYSATPVDPIQKPLEENNAKLSKFMEYDASVRKIATAKGFFDEARPVNAVQTLGLAIFDLFASKQQLSETCHAIESASITLAKVSQNIISLKARIADIEATLSERSSQ